MKSESLSSREDLMLVRISLALFGQWSVALTRMIAPGRSVIFGAPGRGVVKKDFIGHLSGVDGTGFRMCLGRPLSWKLLQEARRFEGCGATR